MTFFSPRGVLVFVYKYGINMKARKILLVFLILYGGYVSAQEVRDSVKIYFRQGYSVLEPSRRNNKEALDRIADSLRTSYADSVYQLKRIQVVGGASPEGSIPLNRRLSVKRANVLFNYLSRYGELPDSLKTNVFLGRDWNGLIRLVSDDPELPYRKETLHLLHELAEDAANDDLSKGDHLRRIQQLRGGVPYWYMYKNIFQSCVPPGYTCGMRKYGILSLPCQCLPLNCLCPSPNRQDLYLSFHICLRSHETCILL